MTFYFARFNLINQTRLQEFTGEKKEENHCGTPRLSMTLSFGKRW